MNSGSVIYKTNNLKTPIFWMTRITIVICLLASLLFLLFVRTDLPISSTAVLLIVASIFIVLFSQVEELTIDSTAITLENKSLLPLLSSKEVVDFSSISEIEVISDKVTNEKGYFLLSRMKKNVLSIITNNGNSLKLKGRLHPNGVKGLEKLVREQLDL